MSGSPVAVAPAVAGDGFHLPVFREAYQEAVEDLLAVGAGGHLEDEMFPINELGDPHSLASRYERYLSASSSSMPLSVLKRCLGRFRGAPERTPAPLEYITISTTT